MRWRVLLRDNLAVVVAGLAMIGLFVLPDTGPPSDGPLPVEASRGRIVAIIDREFPDGEPIPVDEPIAGDFEVEMLEGPLVGQRIEAFLGGSTTEVSGADYAIGDEVVVTFTDDGLGGAYVQVFDRWRLPVLVLLVALFVLAVLVLGRSLGLRALLALALTILVVVKVVIPQLIAGTPPLPLALVVAAGIAVVTILLTEGVDRISLAAIGGTLGALALTAVLGAIVSELARFTAAAGEDLVFLEVSGHPFDVRGLLLGAFVLGALGVLDDVAVTQAATVDELARRTDLRGAALYTSAMRVGRSHIAATINTLFLAYAGASLPLLLLFALSGQPAIVTLDSEVVAVEIVRTVVGSLGILSAVPLTTALATWLADRRDPRGSIEPEIAGPSLVIYRD